MTSSSVLLGRQPLGTVSTTVCFLSISVEIDESLHGTDSAASTMALDYT
jgi:hypothetical protein